MTKSIKVLTVIATILIMSSFANKSSEMFIGTYGVSDSDPSQIKLTINSDNTFYYQDFSIPGEETNITGNWILEGKKVLLKDNNSNDKFHNVWTFIDNGTVAKSRKGLSFYRLYKIDG
ncbi:MAG: hypothetical protein IPL48_08000 [Bacteroidetes bacterium]|nr:hypothetical protein [Bacteroidota bacterium]